MTIKWRLAAVMADKEIKYRDLASRTDLHPNTISKLRNRLPARLDIGTLNKLCEALECQPGDLLIFKKEGDRP